MGFNLDRLREAMLETIRENSTDQNLQSRVILTQVQAKLGIDSRSPEALAVLQGYYGLFRIGYLCWGHNIDNYDAPFFHVTEMGKSALDRASRDPANPQGYLSYLTSKIAITPVVRSYVEEALRAFNTACFKSAAVMIGAASEAIVIDLAAELCQRMDQLGQRKPKSLMDWRTKNVVDGVDAVMRGRMPSMDVALRERFDAYWSSFTNQIRLVRNDAGHPSSIDAVTAPRSQTALLIFPELAELAKDLTDWVKTGYV